MNSKERVLTALNHREPDRVPIQAHFTPEVTRYLENKYQAEGYELEIKIGNDILFYPFGMVTGYYREGDEYTTEWGITWKRIPYKTRFGTGYYTEFVKFPLAEDNAVDEFVAPSFDDVDFKPLKEFIKKYGRDFAICIDLQCTLYEGYKYLRGMEQAFIDLIANQDIVSKVIDVLIDYHSRIGVEAIDHGADLVILGDDLGGQHEMLMSPEIFRKVLKPKMAKMISILRSKRKDIKIAFHSDGYIIPIIDDLIEVGVDLLNPVQPESMSPKELKDRFGERLSFWGTVSVQGTLPFGSVQDVINETKERIRDVGPGGGLILGPTHNVQIDTPPENLEVFFETAKKYGKYPINI
ncbi:MAG: hypothetical protein M1371_03335 [Actinobacteria bacterium]|nr:hypothetical protein [Actinomycetota bacterium]